MMPLTPKPLRFLGLAALVLSCLLGGCASTWVDEPQDDPVGELETVMEAWRTARSEGRSGEPERVALERLLAKYPRDVDLLYSAAVLAHAAGDRERARGHLDIARKLEPRFAEATALRARLALEAGNLRSAERMVSAQLELNPDHPDLYETRAAVFYLSGRHDEAQQDLALAEKFGAPSWRVDYHRGLVAEALGQGPRAADFYRRLLKSHDHPAARSRLRALDAGRPVGDFERP